jgi:hypothetical protein
MLRAITVLSFCAATSALAASPQPLGAAPAAGSGNVQTFTFTFLDSQGSQNLTIVDILINSVLDGRHACYVAFVPSGNGSGSVFLVDDAGDAGGPYAGMVLPGNGVVQNSQCSIGGATSVVSGSGNALALTLSISFKPSFGGNQVIYAAAFDAASNSGWQQLGTWNVPGNTPAGPSVRGMTPARTAGMSQTYTFTFADPNGWQDLSIANILINNAINGASACYVAFAPAGPSSGTLYLVDDAGDAGGPFSSLSLPGSGTVSNSQCTISAAGSSVAASATTISLTLAISFKAGFAGNRVFYLAARSSTLNSNWQATGSVTVTPAASWNGYARDSHHSALSAVASQSLSRIHWQTPVDLQPQYADGELLIHYGSPIVTPQNTVVLPVKTGVDGQFRVDARNAANGSLVWSFASDYVLPPHDWTPPSSVTLTAASRVYFPGPGGTVYYRDSPDSASGSTGQIAFYGTQNYLANPQAFNGSVIINTPITADPAGNIYFGFLVNGSTPVALASGIARIDAGGHGSWIPVAAAANDAEITQVVGNCGPALSWSLGTLYLGVSDGSAGYLIALDAAALAPLSRVRLIDPGVGGDAYLGDNGTSSPTVGFDGDVYYGVQDVGDNHDRGWLLHFGGSLAQVKTPASFGWDDTASLVPSYLVGAYSGSSTYLLMTKYNDYADTGGSGLNRIAILDPNATQIDPLTGVIVMREVITILDPTPNPDLPGVKEWCINSAAVDPLTRSVLANNEDGKLYRWNLVNNSLSETIVLTSGLGEAYTPTLIGADGTVYAINNATLFAVGQ